MENWLLDSYGPLIVELGTFVAGFVNTLNVFHYWGVFIFVTDSGPLGFSTFDAPFHDPGSSTLWCACTSLPTSALKGFPFLSPR